MRRASLRAQKQRATRMCRHRSASILTAATATFSSEAESSWSCIHARATPRCRRPRRPRRHYFGRERPCRPPSTTCAKKCSERWPPPTPRSPPSLTPNARAVVRSTATRSARRCCACTSTPRTRSTLPIATWASSRSHLERPSPVCSFRTWAAASGWLWKSSWGVTKPSCSRARLSRRWAAQRRCRTR